MKIKSLKSFLEEKREEEAREASTTEKFIRNCLFSRNRQVAQLEKDRRDIAKLVTKTLQWTVEPSPFIRFLQESNLLFMGENLEIQDNLTFGADPEFILQPPGKPDEVALFSSESCVPYANNGSYKMSSVAIGADYGLLEIRPYPENTPVKFVNSFKKMIERFEQYQKEIEEDDYYDEDERPEPLEIKKIEAIQFNHKRERIRRKIEKGGDIDFGENVFLRSKEAGVMSADVSDISLAEATMEGMSITAYDRPMFGGQTDDMLTAGGHIHFGGFFIKMLSLAQVKALVRKFDQELPSIAAEVETPAATIRHEQYGMPGEFRLKEHGFEYRVLSCAPFWPGNESNLKRILRKAEKTILNLDFMEA